MVLVSIAVFARDKKSSDLIGKTPVEMIQIYGLPQAAAPAGDGYMLWVYMEKGKRIRFVSYQNVIFYYDIQQELSTGEYETLERYEKTTI